MRRTRTLIAGLCALSCAYLAPAAHAATYPAGSGFGDQTLVSGLFAPTAIAFTPDGTMYITEKPGYVKMVEPGDDVPQLALDISAQVNTFSDRGLLGIAVDSDFASPAHRYLYLLYTYDIGPGEDSTAAMVARLTRVTVAPAPARTIVPGSETVILGAEGGLGSPCPSPGDENPDPDTIDCIPADGASHGIGTVRSAPDGTLYVGSGDASGFGGVDPTAFRTYDERSPAGKILHVDRAGKGLPGHPFCPGEADLDRNCTKVFAKGFRNPFRFSFAGNGSLLVGDVGWYTHEEIDVVPPGGGGNYGWPCREGPGATPGYSAHANCATPQTFVEPVYSYSHPRISQGGAEILGFEYSGAGYPAALQGDLFMGDYSLGFLRRLVPNGQGGYDEVEMATDWFGVDIEPHPGTGGITAGDIVYVDIVNGQVNRVLYSPGNASPVIDADVSPTVGPDDPLEVDFDATASTDPDGDDLTYEWDFEDDGIVDETTATTQHSYAGAFNRAARLTIRDEGGLSATQRWLISPANEAPEVSLDTPLDGAEFRVGEPVQLSGSATDSQDATPDLQWDVRLIHGTHTHFDLLTGQASRNPVTGFVPLTSHDVDSHYEITLSATDDRQVTTEAPVVSIHPEAVPLELLSEPAGVTISYGGRELVTPFAGETAIGFQTTVGAPEQFQLADVPFAFESWSDGGAALHDFTVPDEPVSLVARYRDVTPPPPDPDPDPKPAKRRGPVLRFDAEGGLSADRRVLKGRASDPDGVRRVEIALARRARSGAAAKRCRWVSRHVGRVTGRPRRCSRPRWIRATLSPRGKSKVAWRVRFGRPLARGRYVLRLRATDREGAKSARLAGGGRSVRLTVSRPR